MSLVLLTRMHQSETLFIVFHEDQREDTLLQGSQELFSTSIMCKREEPWGRDCGRQTVTTSHYYRDCEYFWLWPESVFLVLAKRKADSGDENERKPVGACYVIPQSLQCAALLKCCCCFLTEPNLQYLLSWVVS